MFEFADRVPAPRSKAGQVSALTLKLTVKITTLMTHSAGVSLRDSPSLRKLRPSRAPSTGEGASDTHGPPRAPGRQINSSLPVQTAEAPPTQIRRLAANRTGPVATIHGPLPIRCMVTKLRYLLGLRPGKESLDGFREGGKNLEEFDKVAGTSTQYQTALAPRFSSRQRKPGEIREGGRNLDEFEKVARTPT